MTDAALQTGSPEIPDKLYFKIGEVSDLLGVEAYVLRYWETEFSVLSPKKSGTGHRLYRRKDVATDVLSFPAFARAQSPAPSPQSPVRNHFLGDIVIARGVARRQARAAGHSELTELRVLALHGLLHLLGYDHERDDGSMLRIERRLRRKGGLREGLIERQR